MTDEQIVDLYFHREESAIFHTTEKYGARLRQIAQRITQDALTAEECENDTYLEVWRRIPPAEPKDYFPAFLSRIVRNISINRCMERERLKRKAYITELTTEMEQCLPAKDDMESLLDSAELIRLISSFLHRQAKEKRIIFMHRYYYLDSIADIAKHFGYSESKIKTMLFRMRNDLRTYLMKEGYTL